MRNFDYYLFPEVNLLGTYNNLTVSSSIFFILSDIHIAVSGDFHYIKFSILLHFL